MALPDFVVTNNQNEADTLFDPNGDPYLKAAGRAIPVDTSPVDSAPHLVEDATLLAGTGHQVVAAGPVRAKLLAAATPCVRVTVKADVANTHTLYVGLATVTADNANATGGFQLSPGESFTFGVDDVSKVYIHGTAAEGASFAYEL
jgi:hypothetical protein